MNDTNYKPVICVENYKGFLIRKSQKGYCSQRVVGGLTLNSCATVEDCMKAVDSHLEWEAEKPAREAELKRLQAERRAEELRAAKLKLQNVLESIEPIRQFVQAHGLDLLRDCVERLEWEERERNVPSNWEELADKCDTIAQYRVEHSGWGEDAVRDVDVTKHGVTEHIDWNSRLDQYTTSHEYGLQEYADLYWDDLPEDAKDSGSDD